MAFGVRRFGVPVARGARLVFAVGTKVVRFGFGFLGDFVIGAEMKAGVLRIAVERDRFAGRRDERTEFNELSRLGVVDGKFALLIGELFALRAVPADLHLMPAEDEAFFLADELFVPFEGRGFAMPDVALQAVAVRHAVEAEEESAMVRELSAGAFRNDARTVRGVDMMKRLVRRFARLGVGFVEFGMHVAEHPLAGEAKFGFTRLIAAPSKCLARLCRRLARGRFCTDRQPKGRRSAGFERW